MIEPVYEKINVCQRIGNVQEQIKIDCKTQVSSGEISSILSVTPWVSAEVIDVQSGKIKYGGKAVFYIAFLSEEGEIKKCECGSEFSGEIRDGKIGDGFKASLSISVEKTDADVSGARLSVSAYLDIVAEVSECKEIPVLVGGDGLVSCEAEITCVKGQGLKKGVYPLEEEFELSYAVSEVLFHRSTAVITAVQAGVGTIIVDGEVLFSAIMLQKNDKNDIIRENKVFPFRMEIESEDAMPNMCATAMVKEKAFKVDVAVDDDGKRSVVTVSASLLFEGEVFGETELKVACDAFSTENEVEILKDDYPFFSPLATRSHVAVVSGRAQTGELPVGATVLATCGERAVIVGESCDDSGVNITGVLFATAYLRDGDGKVFTRKLEIPFEKSFDGSYPCGTIAKKVIKAENAKSRIISLTEIDLEAEIYLNVYPEEKKDRRLISEIKELGKKKVSDSAISVYIAREGEDEWSLAKRLNVCPDALRTTNKDLQFPLSGTERIVVYRNK